MLEWKTMWRTDHFIQGWSFSHERDTNYFRTQYPPT